MFEILMWLGYYVGPLVLGAGAMWIAGKSRGKNARNAFRLGAWGFWLTYLRFLAPMFPLFPISWALLLVPSGICFVLAANSLMKEMRAQQKGEYTDVA